MPPAHGLGHLVDGDAVGLEAVGIEVDLVLLAEAADGRHLGDAGHGLEMVPQIPVLERPELGQVVVPGLVDQRVLVDPAQGGGVGPELGLDPLGELGRGPARDTRGPRTGPVDVGALLENDVDVGKAEIREAADGLDPGRAEHGRDDRIGHLILDDVGAPVPAGEDDDLGVAEVGDGVEGQMLDGPDADEAGRGQRR